MEPVGLSEALDELRKELYRAADGGAGQQLRFEVERAELELEVEFRREGQGKVKVTVGAWGAKAEGEGGRSLGSVSRQRLTLSLKVQDEATGGQSWKAGRGAGRAVAPSDAGTGQDDGVAGVELDDVDGVPPWER